METILQLLALEAGKKKKSKKTKNAEIYFSALHKQIVRSENLGSLGANPTVQLEKFNAVVLLNC